MNKLVYFFDRVRDVKVADYLSVIPMGIALIIKPFFKKKYCGSWLICEEPYEARDNGYHFFKYMKEQQTQQKCYYAIKRKSVDFRKVERYGDIIEHGSVQHWLAYFLCEYNISSQKGGKPNAAMCAFMEMNGVFKPQNVFLQHGITINDVRWLYADRSRFKYFITSTTEETAFIEENFGYPEGTVHMTGMPRFDELHDDITKSNRILIMPTWRYWFNLRSKRFTEVEDDFVKSEYFQKWMEVINGKEFNDLIEANNLEVVFYPHRNMQSHINDFRGQHSKVIIASDKDYDVQELLKTSAMMITDYSSVFFDMVYQKKPVVFYQFDKDTYRKHQYQRGYFDYEDNPFGHTVITYKNLIDEIERLLNFNLGISNDYLIEHDRIFKHWDKNNCERVYTLLKQ